MLTILEKVLLLQSIDVFSEVPTEPLGALAVTVEELSLPAGSSLYAADDPADSMFVVVEGRVRLHKGSIEVNTVSAGEAFGTWALFDDENRVTSATTLEDASLLRLDKADFIEVLADNVEVTRGVLKGIVRRLRTVLTTV